MQYWFRKRYEAALIKLAAWILLERNVPRSPVVSRQDNNKMFEMAYTLKDIESRIRTDYNNV